MLCGREVTMDVAVTTCYSVRMERVKELLLLIKFAVFFFNTISSLATTLLWRCFPVSPHWIGIIVSVFTVRLFPPKTMQSLWYSTCNTLILLLSNQCQKWYGCCTPQLCVLTSERYVQKMSLGLFPRRHHARWQYHSLPFSERQAPAFIQQHRRPLSCRTASQSSTPLTSMHHGQF